ncbi:MAG: CSLREA domain-containing protein, partial [Acidobacteria bacterium]|nr:CSLREA domain-containing protein [Acidobacteriota bacterium]
MKMPDSSPEILRVAARRRSAGVQLSALVRFVILTLAFTLVSAFPSLVFAATFTVDSTADEVDATPGDGICATAGGACTLRAAVQEANADIAIDTIDLPAGIYSFSLAGMDEDIAASGDLDIT